MSQALTLARPYARAAYAIARDHRAAAQWSEALGFAARVAADPRVQSLLGHPQLERSDAVALLSPPAAGNAGAPDLFSNDLFGNFLAMLADNRRLPLLPEIAGLFEELRAEADRVVKARITSATTLPAAEFDNIDGSLKGKLSRLQSALAQ
jgi:F-type H+-transporting ATPase subunit delta